MKDHRLSDDIHFSNQQLVMLFLKRKFMVRAFIEHQEVGAELYD